MDAGSIPAASTNFLRYFAELAGHRLGATQARLGNVMRFEGGSVVVPFPGNARPSGHPGNGQLAMRLRPTADEAGGKEETRSNRSLM